MTSLEREFGELKALMEHTHEDVTTIKKQLDTGDRELTDLRLQVAKHQVWFKILAGFTVVLVAGGGGAASLLSIFRG